MNESKLIKKRLLQFASEANKEKPGALDDLSNHMRRMPESLRSIRKQRIGRHRIYYSGSHQSCRYDVVYIKAFKKGDVDNDDEQNFQKRLINLLTNNNSAQNILLEPSKA